MSSTIDRLTRHLEEVFGRRHPLDGERLIVGFSGGADSCALLLGLARADLPGAPLAVHVDHRLDPESTRRAERARELAERIGVELHVRSGTVSEDALKRDGLESAARDLRYRLLETERLESGARWIATAHHRDDQIETALLRMSRGSGLRGLAAMPAS
ncbi:MAG: tRNA lysidine(34) synthetase TilS, partial [Thermoanaerobaculia bacterium]|nr:tRNA lysidine(34) synthetase TilS [Thermoanaerobaculia bacterium]